MQVVACAKELKKAMRVAIGVCPSRTPMEILRYVKVVCDDQMHIIATDGMQVLRVLVPDAEVEQPGECLLPAKQGNQVVQRAEGDVLIGSSDSGVRMECGHDKFKMLTDPVSLFPSVAIDSVSENYCHLVESTVLERAIKRTVFVKDPLNARYALAGTALDLRDGGASFFVGTDGRRVTAQRVDAHCFGGHHCNPQNTIAPTEGMRALSEAIRFTEADEVRLCCGASALVAEAERFSLSCPWLEGRFPSPWQNMMVQKDSAKHEDASCNAGDLLEGLKKSEIMADEGEIAVRLTFRDGEIVLSRHGSCIGDSEVIVEADVLGEEATAKMNPTYMREWLATLDQEEDVAIRYPTSGVHMQLSCKDGGYYTQSVMADVVQTASSV